MSKYIKLEDAINAIEDKIAEYIPTLYGRYGEIPLELRMAITSLPTIEVEEDCISRSKIVERIEKYKEPCMRPSEMWLIDDIIKVVEKAQSIVPRESEE